MSVYVHLLSEFNQDFSLYWAPCGYRSRRFGLESTWTAYFDSVTCPTCLEYVNLYRPA